MHVVSHIGKMYGIDIGTRGVCTDQTVLHTPRLECPSSMNGLCHPSADTFKYESIETS